MKMYCKNCKETYDSSYFVYCPRCGLKLEVKPIPNIRGQKLEEQIFQTEDLLDEAISERKDIENHLKKLTFEYVDLQHKISNETDKDKAIELKFIAMKTQEEISKIDELLKEANKKEEELSKSLENLKNELKILKEKQIEQINKEKHKDFVFKKIYVADDISLKILYRLYEPIGFERDKTTAINRLIDICPFELVESDLDTIENEGVSELKKIDMINYDDEIKSSIQKLNLITKEYKDKLYKEMISIYYDETDEDNVPYRLDTILTFYENIINYINGICPSCGYDNTPKIRRCYHCGEYLVKDPDGSKREDIDKIKNYIKSIKPTFKKHILEKQALQHRNNQILNEKEELLIMEGDRWEEEEDIEELADTYCYENGFDKWEYYKEGILFKTNYHPEMICHVEDKYLTEEELRSIEEELRSMKNNSLTGIRIRSNY